MSDLRGNAYLRSKRDSVKGIFSVAPCSVIRDLHKAVFLVECTLDQLFGQIRDVFAGKGLIDVEPEDLTVLVVVGDGVSGYIVGGEGDIPVLLIETDADELLRLDDDAGLFHIFALQSLLRCLTRLHIAARHDQTVLADTVGVAGQQYLMVADDDAGDRLSKLLLIHNDFLGLIRF